MITHLVDSDLTIDYLKQRADSVSLLRPLLEAGYLAISVVTYAEVSEGIAGAHDESAARERFQAFLDRVTVLTITTEVADVFAEIRRDLRAKGQLLADLDTWIAATAIRHDLVLLTRDNHFNRIAELKRG